MKQLTKKKELFDKSLLKIVVCPASQKPLQWDSKKNELERFYGFLEPKPFLQKLIDIRNGKNTFPILQAQYESGDNSAETMSMLAKKYGDKS